MIELFVLMLKQDDPFRCTAAKLVKFNLIRRVSHIYKDALVLNPFATVTLIRQDVKISSSVCAIDCSWSRANDELKYRKAASHGIQRRLPLLLAANPTNYSRAGMLSTVEALAGSVYILGFRERAAELMNKFKWGHTFLELNANILEEYSNAESSSEIADLEKAYFPQLY